MTPHAQRIAIAELTGLWKDSFVIEGQHGDYDQVVGYMRYDDGTWTKSAHEIPEYFRDINAIREACLWAIDNLWDSDQVLEFARHLERRHAHYMFEDRYDTAQIIIRSTAEDWCYAFLKTSNLWTDD